MATSDLPEEIMIDIFSRLPVKSVGKCRCLSKSWRITLSSPQFIKSHLNRKSLNQQNLILITPSNSIHTIADVKDDAVSRKLRLGDDWVEVVGSCDGLVLLENEKDEKFLVNPITLHKAKIPNSPLALKKEESRSMHGFGYDSSIDDYKIVTLSYYDSDSEYDPDCVDTFVDVYHVKMGVWKRVESSPYDHAVSIPSRGAFLNGALHWLACSRESGYPSVIAAFDLAREVFDEIPAPSCVNNEKFVFYELVVLGDCLCMIDDRSRNFHADIWIMKEYGLAESWTEFSIDCDYYECDILKPLCFIGDEEVVLMFEDETLVVHNLKEGTSKIMVVDGVPAMFVDGGIFMGSLLSPTFNGISELEMVTCELPQELLIDIFSRLPAKSVGKFRCLSKKWRNILSSPNFIKSHLNLNTHQENLLLIAPSQSLNSIATIKNEAFSRKLELPDNWVEVFGSCGGLVLLLNEEGEKFLVNPITLQLKKVPHSPLALCKCESLSMSGFGYDGSIDDYKIVTLSYNFDDTEFETDFVDTFVDVYYVKRGCWKRVENSPFSHTHQNFSFGVFLNGAIHWLASSKDSNYRSVIAAFDLVREVFDEIPPPSGVNVNFVFYKLVVLGGYLCMVDARSNDETDNDQTDVWIMREYGLAESWTKFSINCGQFDRNILKPLCCIGDDEEIVWMTEEESLVIYNLKEETFRDMVVDGVPAYVLDGCIFVESLVSPCYDIMS